MPFLNCNGARIHYTESGSGTETIVFAHGLLWDGRLFGPQIEALRSRYRCITFDFRGQGQSEVTKSGYDMDSLTEDTISIIQELGVGPCHFVSLSMGGFIGLRMGIRRPELLKSLTLLETSAEPEPKENVPRYRKMAFVARWLGLGMVQKPVMKIMFGQKFLNDSTRISFREELRKRVLSNSRTGIARATRGVIDRAGVSDDLGRIHIPTLIVVGDQDVATIPAKAERMHAGIPGSKLVVIPGAGHTSTLEEPELVTETIREFLDSQIDSRMALDARKLPKA